MDDLDLGSTVKGFSPGQKVFSRYTLRKILGRGGMGVVWLARDDELERDVALKFLPEVVAMDSEALRDLKRETRRSLELTHPHVIRIYDFVQDERMAAISMEYVAGETLAQRKLGQPEQCFEPSDLLPWLRQLVEALDHAHRKARVVHRDLKPANLMLDAQGDLKIADFGIAASVSDSVSRVSAQAGSSGTPVFMSPQQMMGEKPAVTDDIYSVGATLYDLLTGKPPFFSGNVIAQVQSRTAPSLSDRRLELGVRGSGRIPPAWEETIAACLAKEPKARPQSAREILERLQGAGGSVRAEPPPSVASSTPPPTKPAAAATAVPSAPLPTPQASPDPALPVVSGARRWWWAPVAAAQPWSWMIVVAAVTTWLRTPAGQDDEMLIVAIVGALTAFGAQYLFFLLLLAIRRPWKVRHPYGIMVLGALAGGILAGASLAAAESVAVGTGALFGALAGALQGWLLHRIAVGVRPEDQAAERGRRPVVFTAAAIAFLAVVGFFGYVLPTWQLTHDNQVRLAREERERYEAEKLRLQQEEEARLERERKEAEEREAERLRQAKAAEEARQRAQRRRDAEPIVQGAFQGVLNRAPTPAELSRYADQLADDTRRTSTWLRQVLRESPEGRKGGRVLVPGEFKTIREAIAAAAPGNVVVISPGIYRESITLDKNVSLEGGDRDRTILEWTANNAVLHASGVSGVSISRLSFRHVDTHDQDSRSSAVSIVDSSVTFTGNRVLSSNGNGLHIKGSAKSFVTSNEFRGARWAAIALYEGTSSEISGNLIADNDIGLGVWALTAGTLISDNRVQNNGSTGVWVSEGDNVSLVGNRIVNNGAAGKGSGGLGISKGRPRLRNNEVRDNPAAGIWWQEAAKPIIEAGNMNNGQLMPVTP